MIRERATFEVTLDFQGLSLGELRQIVESAISQRANAERDDAGITRFAVYMPEEREGR